MLADFEQLHSVRLDLDQESKLKHKLDIKHHNFIDSLRTTKASREISDRKIKLNLLILIQILPITSKNTPKISKHNLPN